jgi:uncharacterized membrane protein
MKASSLRLERGEKMMSATTNLTTTSMDAAITLNQNSADPVALSFLCLFLYSLMILSSILAFFISWIVCKYITNRMYARNEF